MKILFITSIYPTGTEDVFMRDTIPGGLAIPSNVFQWAVINGLLENGADLSVVSYPSLPTFPRYKKFITEERPVTVNNNVIGQVKSYCTLPFVKEPYIILSLKKSIKKWAQSLYPNEKGVILMYGIYGPFIKAAVQVSKNYKNIYTCPIATDLFVSSLDVLKKYSFLKKIQGYFEYKAIQFGLNRADFFVLLAKGMVKYVPRAEENHIIIEGIAGDKYPRPAAKQQTKERSVLYTGSLAEHTSVKELVDAFMQTTDPNFRLQICGVGFYSDYITEMSKIDNRILYFGSVTRDKALELQKKATVLINPRLPSIPDTPYSFPSKTIEYLASGTPMIGYKLVGITEDYYNYFYIPRDESIEALSECITETLHKTQLELDKRALDSWEFITRYKTSKMQMKKLVEYFKERSK